MSSDSVQEILFTELLQSDMLVMETGRSVYTFTVVDRSNRRGALTGGNVPHPRDAVFSGSLLPTRDIWEAGVRLGARAAFFLTVPTDMSGFSQVITSPLVRISIRRGGVA